MPTPDADFDDFAAQVERGLLNLYHGETGDRRVHYRVVEGAWPDGLSGRTFTTVFPYQSLMSSRQIAAAPNMLAAPGRVLTMDLSAPPSPDGPRVTLSTQAVRNDAWHLRQLAPEAFVRTDFAEFSWFGLSNLSNTTPIPAFRVGHDGVRLLLSYDAGRPVEASPVDLEFVSPVGRLRDYHAAAHGVFSPMIMTTGHPVYDPAFEPARPRLLFTNLVPRIESFLALGEAVRAELHVVTWDGEHPGPTAPLRVCVGGKPVIMDQASAHQLCLTRDHLVILGSTLVLGVASLVNPLRPLLRDALREGLRELFGQSGADALDRVNERIPGRHAASVPPSETVVFVIEKAALRRALAEGATRVAARAFTLDWEATHAVADHACDDDRITLYCQHNIGADPADQLEPGDALVGGGTVRRELEGILSSSTDLNQVRKHVIDLRRGTVTTTAYPDPAGDAFAHGLNLLPPLQVLPYRPAGDAAGYDLQRCVDRMDHTVWVTGGYIPCTMDQRVFDIFHRARVADREVPRRLVPHDEYLRRARDPGHTVRVFRLDRDLALESEYVFPAGWFMGAPIFVPRRDAATLRDGWLLGQVWGPDEPHMEVWIWDAARPLSDGPVAKLGPETPADALQPGFPLHSSWIDDAGVANWERPDYTVPTIEVSRSIKALALLTVAGTGLSRWVRQRFRP
jgi:hypothetical protein